ncbi:MAG: hypothetical protein OEY23_06965 [Acidimicrobiia bacterium]|nr:hypothetical protein [Acidimicrobiia bacterium]
MARIPESVGNAYKRRPKLISHEQAVATSIALLEAEGTSGLSMRKLAAGLAVSLPTVYATIGSREQLVEDLLGQVTAELLDATAREPRAAEAIVAWIEDRPWYLDLVRELDLEVRRSVWGSVATQDGRGSVEALRSRLAAESSAQHELNQLDATSLLDLLITSAEFADRLVRAGWTTREKAGATMVDMLASVLAPGHERVAAGV